MMVWEIIMPPDVAVGMGISKRNTFTNTHNIAEPESFCYFFTFHINFETSVIFPEDRLGVFCVFADVDCFESDYFRIFLLKTTNHNGNKYYIIISKIMSIFLCHLCP